MELLLGLGWKGPCFPSRQSLTFIVAHRGVPVFTESDAEEFLMRTRGTPVRTSKIDWAALSGFQACLLVITTRSRTRAGDQKLI